MLNILVIECLSTAPETRVRFWDTIKESFSNDINFSALWFLP